MEAPHVSGSDSASPSSAAVWSPLRFFRFPISTLLEHSGVLRIRPEGYERVAPERSGAESETPDSGSGESGELTIRIIGNGEQDRGGAEGEGEAVVGGGETAAEERGVGGGAEAASVAVDSGGNAAAESVSGGTRDSSYQRYDVQQVARFIEQILPFTLLLLVVFIRQHLQGFFVTIWVTAFLFKSNDILRKQTALKGERRMFVLVGYLLAFMLHVIVIYWWYWKAHLFYPLVMLPLKAIPPFWHAVFIVLVNDTMVRQTAMAVKLVLLMHYKNGRGHHFRRQGQMLTLVEYTLLLYRALIPTPVWYRFFLNKDYGSVFSALTTGLYLTFKLTTIVEKVQSFFTALKALSKKDVHYGAYATPEQVNASGDMCAICQEKMQAPILLRCNHIFCEDCVSEWFERERTCPLCRALVRASDLQSFGDGSTSLFFQLF